MNQKILYTILAVVAVVLLALWVVRTRTAEAPGDVSTTTAPTSTPQATAPSPETTTIAPTAVAAPRGDFADGSYALVTSESVIRWTGRKPKVLGYEDSGTLALAQGSIDVANGAIVSGSFVIDMATLTAEATTNSKGALASLESHLKSADFFDVEQYPEASFVLKNVTNGAVTGDLTIKGITKTISFPATISADGDRLVADANLTLNRSLWDIRYGSGTFFDDLGNNLIADEMSIALHLVASR